MWLLWLLLLAVVVVARTGSIIAAVPPVLLALVQFGTVHAAAVAAGFVALNVVIGNVVEPRVMGRGLGLSTLVVILSLLFWGWVWGPVGALLAVPMTMIVKILFENTPDLAWVAVLLGKSAPDPVTGPTIELPSSDVSTIDSASGPRSA